MQFVFFVLTELLVGVCYAVGSQDIRRAVIRTSPINKVSVNVADILSRQSGPLRQHPSSMGIPVVGRFERALGDAPGRYEAQSWREEKRDPFSEVDVKIAGQQINQASLTMSPPSSDLESIRKLRRILGRDFEPEWMSIESPANPLDGIRAPRGYPKVDKSLVKELHHLNLTGNLAPHVTKRLKDWLMKKATCPIEFIWENLGPTFWPQHIRHGHCRSGNSCSWPSGMSCRQSGSRKLKMLRWVCQSGNGAFPFKEQTRYRRQLHEFGSRTVLRRKRGGRDPERRLRRVARLIRQLSYHKDGYVCRWTAHEQIVSDECKCSCN